MTKSIYYYASLLLASALGLGAQEAVVRRGTPSRPRTQAEQATPSRPKVSQRALDQSQDFAEGHERYSWLRTIYRRLDLEREANAVLYYPTRTTERSSNLFAHIFRLINSDQLTAYEYIDGTEIFEPEYAIKFGELLERFRIHHTVSGRGQSNSRYQVALSDIPSAEVRAYYLKERWFFDQSTSTYDVRIEAICPILYDMGDYGELAMPMMWIPYEQLRPYLVSQPAMLSSLNNVEQATLDDYFRLRLYDGEIVKTANLRGLSLVQSVSSPDSLAVEQRRIERELKTFGERLYVRDSLAVEPTTERTQPKSSTNSRDKRVRATSSTSTKAPKTKAPKAPKSTTPKASSGRSARGRG